MKRLPGSHSTEHRGTQTGSVSSPISKAEIKQSQPPHLLLAQDQGDSSNYRSWEQDVSVGEVGFYLLATISCGLSATSTYLLHTAQDWDAA